MGDDKIVEVQAIGKFRLLLKTGNLISVSALDKFGFSCSFGNGIFSLFHDSKLVGSGSLLLNDNLYTIDSITSYNESLQLSSQGIKRKATNENSASLWHKRLGHISKRRMERLVSDGILGPLIFTNMDVCVECIKGKQTNQRRYDANRYLDVLELIHTDTCGPFPSLSWNGQLYFISFIDNYSRFGYIYISFMKRLNH